MIVRSQDRRCDTMHRNIQLVCVFLLSRLLAFGLAAVSQQVVPRHRSADAYRFVQDSSDAQSAFTHWDGQHFLAVANQGYIEEQHAAFFPGFPMMIRMLAACTGLTTAIAGLLLSNGSFVLALFQFRKILELVGIPSGQSDKYSVFLIFSPITMFFMALYSESWYMLLVLLGLRNLLEDNTWKAAFWFCVASSVRSNGILNAVYLVMYYAHLYVQRDPSKRHVHSLRGIGTRLMLQCIIILLPSFTFQLYLTQRFCQDDRYADRPYCTTLLPSIYSFVQSHYWNLGFFSYYDLLQLPNFALALPITAAAIRCMKIPFPSAHMDVAMKIHMVILLLIGYTVMHVQVLTRIMLSGVPLLHYAIGRVYYESPRRIRRLIVCWIVLYYTGGLVLFTNGYPWT